MADGQLVHGTAIAIRHIGVLIVGKAGAGKSDLALRLIDRGATLVADDAVKADLSGDQIMLSCMPNIEGKLEIRNIGIQSFDATKSAPLALCVMLDDEPTRFPEPSAIFEIEGVRVPKISLNGFEASAPIKVELALAGLEGHNTADDDGC